MASDRALIDTLAQEYSLHYDTYRLHGHSDVVVADDALIAANRRMMSKMHATRS